MTDSNIPKKRGRTPLDIETKAYSLMLAPMDAEWAKTYPGGLSALVRRCLSDVRRGGGLLTDEILVTEADREILQTCHRWPDNVKRQIIKLLRTVAPLLSSRMSVSVSFTVVVDTEQVEQDEEPRLSVVVPKLGNDE